MTPLPASRRNLTLFLLGLVATINYIDRQAFTVLMEDIKRDLVLSDTVLGLISGLVFGVIYALSSLPIARYGDRGDRPLVIATCLGFWSLATAACGLAANAWQIALARIGVAVGESGSAPSSMSLLTEIFPENRRTLVVGVMQSANSIGLSLGVVLAAWLATLMEWRHVFMTLGLPGILLAIAVALMASEPRRALKKAGTPTAHLKIPLREVAGIIFTNTALLWIGLLSIAVSMTGFGFLMWAPSFLQRVHGFDMGQVSWLGWAILTGLVGGNLTAGWMGDRFGSKNPKFNGWLAAGGLLAAYPFALAFAWVASPYWALASFVVLKFLMTLWMAPTIVLTFTLVPVAMRATINAVMSLLIILSGMGLGTFFVGLLSDLFNASQGREALRYALVVMSSGLLVGAFAAIMASRSVARQVAARLVPAQS